MNITIISINKNKNPPVHLVVFHITGKLPSYTKSCVA